MTYDCPATGFKSKCRKERCPEWIHIRGKNPQTGAEMDMPDCARRWMPVLMLDLAKETRQLAAAVESSRNEAKKDAEALVPRLMLAASKLSGRPLVFEPDADSPRLGVRDE